jgi:hypothetical protein
MLKQILLGGLLGGITLFMWGIISWAVLDWHNNTVRSHEGIHAVVENIDDHLPETGVYYFPPMTFEKDDTEAMDAWMELHRTEPHGMIIYNATPGDPMPPMRLLSGFMVNIVTCMMASVLLALALPSLAGYWQRVLFVLSLGVFAIISIHLVQFVFHDMPTSWTTGQALDMTAASLFLGLVLAGIVKNK